MTKTQIDLGRKVAVISNFFNELLAVSSLNQDMKEKLSEARTKLILGDNIDDVTIPYKGIRINDNLPLLHYAIVNENQDAFKILFKNTRDFNLMSLKGYTPLHMVAFIGNLEILKDLLNTPQADLNKASAGSDYLVSERKV